MTSARELGLHVEKISGGEELVLCPFHSDNTPSAWFNPKKGLFYCAVCHLGLNVSQLAGKLGVEGYVFDEWEEGEKNPEDYVLIDEQQTYDLGEVVHHEYLGERKISSEVAERYGVRVKRSNPEAIVFPITKFNGKVQGVIYRYLNPDESGTRYKIMGSVPAVWPLHLVPTTKDYPLILTEGPFSAMRLHQYGWQNGVELHCFALIGAKANRLIVDTLHSFNCIFLYDSDKAGKWACQKMREMWPSTRAYTLSVSPDDMDDDQLGQLILKLG